MPTSALKEQAICDLTTGTPPAPLAARVRMGLEVAVDLVLCGALVILLGILARHMQPDLPAATLFTGLVGGGLCVLWGVSGRHGARCRALAMVTLAAMAFVFARQAVQLWQASAEIGSKGRMVAALMTVLVVLCVGMLANLAREGKGLQQ